MKKIFQFTILIAIAILVGVSLSYAGSLTPSASPVATSYTLNDIYTRLTTNATTTAGNHSLSTSTSPTASFYTLTEIYAGIPTIDATKVLTGTTYLGVAGSASAGNATVPENAPILPPQALVDAFRTVFTGGAPEYGNDSIKLTNRGITHFDPTVIFERWNRISNNTCAIDLSGNAIPEGEINAILAAVADDYDFGDPQAIDLSGGTNAAPTGQGLTDKAFLISHGWTVVTN